MTTETPLSDEDKEIVREVARALFINSEDSGADKSKAQERWQDKRADLMREARRLIRTLERRDNLELILTENSALAEST
ncbi:MAG: hypothetical protein ACU0BN_02520 [Sulfitobacter sp.]|jgi:hypothetical protein